MDEVEEEFTSHSKIPLIMDPEPSQPLAKPTTDHQPESTADSKPVPAMKPEQMPEAFFVPEPKTILESDQVQEPAPTSIMEGVLLEFECMRYSPKSPFTAVSNQLQVSCISAGSAQLQMTFIGDGST